MSRYDKKDWATGVSVNPIKVFKALKKLPYNIKKLLYKLKRKK
jgi:hypothetical protein